MKTGSETGENGSEFPVHEGELLAWDAGLYMTTAEERIGFPRARAVLRQMLIHRPEQFQREKREMLTASFDRVFGHNARKAMALYESIESEGDMSEIIEADEYELAWEAPIDPADYGVTAWRPTSPGRGQVIVPLPENADDELLHDLENNLDSQGVERQIHGNARTLKFWTSSSNPSQIKLEIAAKIIRRWREGNENHA